MNAPERIWAGPNGEYWSSENIGYKLDTEYIRADLVQDLINVAIDIDRKYCDNDLGPIALAMGKLREAYMRIK